MKVLWLAVLMLTGTAQVLSQPATKWVNAKDGFRAHWYYVGVYGSLIGEYYQQWPDSKFVAQCDGSVTQHQFVTEFEARNYVERCKAN